MTLQKTHLSRSRPSFLLAVLAWLACAVPLSAQVSSFYSFAQSAGTWSTITGGTRLNTTNNAFDDQVYTVTIPEFFYDGSYYTTMYVSANGFITFGTAPSGTLYTPLSNNAGYAGAISVFGANLANAASGTREIRYEQVGNELVVQWRGARRSAQAESFDLQIRLHTVTGAILFRYNNSSPSTSTDNYPQVGLRGPNNTFATNVNNRSVEASSGAGATWANTANGANNDSRCRYNSQQAGRSPVNGQTYTWAPACIPPAAEATVTTDCATNTYTIHVDVTRLGSAANVNIQSPNGTNVHTGVGVGSYTVGPIAIGTARTVRIVHTGNATCNVDLGSFNSAVSCITNGDCLANPYLSIPDNGCSSNDVRTAAIAISGLNNTLGTNVDLQSVELIAAHASRGQLQVRLTSPTGQTRNISISRGGNGDNIGNPGSCPGSAATFSDDAASAFTTTGNNPTGSYRPDETLAGFTGDPNGLWTVTICDGTNNTTGTLRYVRLNFCDRPVITATTSNSPVCGADQLALGVTATGTGLTYAWTGTGTFSPNATSANVTVSGGASGSYSVTVSNGCSSVVENFAVVVNPTPTGVTANSSAASVCSNANTVNLTGGSDLGGSPTLLQEGFEGGGIPAGWQVYNTSTGGTPAAADWKLVQSPHVPPNISNPPPISSNDASQFVMANSDLQGSGSTTNTMLQLPVLNTLGYSTLSLSFHHYYRRYQNPENANVEVSTDGSTWTSVAQYTTEQLPANGFANPTINLNAYVGLATLHLRFRYYATYDYYWAIDNVTVSGTPIPATFAWTSVPSGFTSSLQNPTGVAVTQNTTYTVTVTAPNGCTATANTAVAHVQAAAATIAYPASPYCVGGGSIAVQHTGTMDGAYSSTAGLSINAATGAIDPDASTPGTYTVTYTVAAAAPCAQFQTTAEVTVSLCSYYSRASGALADPIWSLTPNGTAGYASWNDATAMVVQSGHTVTNGSNEQVGDITVENGATLALGTHSLTSSGSVAVQGTLTAGDNSTLAIAGSGARTLSLSAATSFWDLTFNTPDGATLTGNATMRNTLLLEAGQFDCTGNPVALESNATRTGRLGPVGATASYVGNLTVNRFIPAGATNWRMMGSPVAGQTVNNWKDDFTTAGFPGSHSPTFSNPVGSGILWPSIRWYDETNTGAAVNDGLVGATGTTQPLAVGQGFAAWCGTGLTTTTAFNVDVTGNPHIAHTPITLPMSYTNTGVADTDGWNMVSNPLASPIAFDQISRGDDVADYITYFNPANGNLATWDLSEGLGTNGGSNVIQSSQAFWLKATGPAVTTTVTEQAKVNNNTGGFFGGAQVQTANLVRLRIQSAINQYSDETVVLFSSGQPGYDGNDVPKFIFAHPDAPQIASVCDGGELIAINAYGPYSTDISIPVMVDVAVNGQYTIVASGLHNTGLSCLRLEDLATGISTPLIEGATYSFTALTTDDASDHRFLLRATAPIVLAATNATCTGRDDGSASLDITSGPVDVTWMDAADNVILEQHGVEPGTASIMALEAGVYSVRIAGDAACGTLRTTFRIDEPAELEADAITMPASCPGSEDGSIDLTVHGGVAPYTILWSNEATTEDLEVAGGTYTVQITDANGCAFAPQEYVVGAGEGPEAGIAVEATLVTVDEDIVFSPATLEGVSNTWDFGDGNTSNDLEAVHSYNVPGSYTVTLTVDNGDCVSTTSIVVDVQTGTGVPTVAGHSLNAYVSGEHIVVDHDFGTEHPVLIRVFSTGGQLAQEHRVSHAPARITLPANELATGIWLVRVSSGEAARTFSLPIVH